MLWFEGSVAEAIQKSRSTGAYFVVYVRGSENDSKSEEFDGLLETPALSAVLDSEKFVKIQLRLGSVECNQFSQIYPVIVVPSIYFIDQQGTPTEVIGGNVSANALLERIHKLIGVQESEQQQSSQNVMSSTQPESIPEVSHEARPVPEHKEPALEQSEPVPEQKEPTLERKEQVPEPAKQDLPEQAVMEVQPEVESEPALESHAEEHVANVSEPDAARPPSPGDTQFSLEAKLEKARQLTEAIRIKKEKEEREKEKRQEVERRETLKNLQKFKKEQEEREMKELAEQRRKEKEADRLAREKVKKQIEQDRLEKAAKFNTAKNEAMVQKEEETKKMAEQKAAKSASDAAARRNFRLTTTVPRREFGSEDLNTTLRALELAPSAAILVIPSDSIVQSSGRYGMLSSLVQVIISPLFAVLGYIRLFIFGTPTTERRDPTSPPAKKSKIDDQAESISKAGSSSGDFEDSAGSLRRRNLGANAAIKREGNIHRFVDRADDDEENNTWNGNSTQQM